MLHALGNRLGDAFLDRSTLWVNHLLGAEPVARARLVPHVGRTLEVRLANWPGLLPAAPPTLFRVTPAGLVERVGDEFVGEPDLRVVVDAANPALAAARAVGGTRPRIELSGDAAFAADLNWLIDNLRWDVEDDLARLVGPAPAREIARVGSRVVDGLRAASRTVGGWAARR